MKHFDFVTVLVTLVVGFSLIILFTILRLSNKMDKPKKHIERSKLINLARTGDIVGVSYDSIRGKLVKIWTGSMWAHVGIVVVIPNRKTKYVLEVARYSKSERGIMMKPLTDWLEGNDTNITAWRPYIGTPINFNLIAEFIHDHNHVVEDMFVGRWLNSVIHRRYTSGCKKKFFCSELVAHLLHYCGILQKIRDCSSYKPWEFVYGPLETKEIGCYGVPNIIS